MQPPTPPRGGGVKEKGEEKGEVGEAVGVAVGEAFGEARVESLVGDAGEAVVGVAGESGAPGGSMTHSDRLLEDDADAAARGVFDGLFGLGVEFVVP